MFSQHQRAPARYCCPLVARRQDRTSVGPIEGQLAIAQIAASGASTDDVPHRAAAARYRAAEPGPPATSCTRHTYIHVLEALGQLSARRFSRSRTPVVAESPPAHVDKKRAGRGATARPRPRGLAEPPREGGCRLGLRSSRKTGLVLGALNVRWWFERLLSAEGAEVSTYFALQPLQKGLH